MVDIIFATGNAKKIQEAKAIIPNIAHQKIDVIEPQSMDSKWIGEFKAKQAYEQLGKPIIIEDVSFAIDELNGFPGPLTKFFFQSLTPEYIGQMWTDSSAEVTSRITYYDGAKFEHFLGIVKGTISEKKTEGWNIDEVFIPEGETKTFAEMTAEKKNSISHRKIALTKLKEFLENK